MLIEVSTSATFVLMRCRFANKSESSSRFRVSRPEGNIISGMAVSTASIRSLSEATKPMILSRNSITAGSPELSPPY